MDDRRHVSVRQSGSWLSINAGFNTFLGGIQLIGIGVLGEYIGRIYVEVKGRLVTSSKTISRIIGRKIND
jgi:hypothetical protein